ncbi:serine hydrolase domain-containing protein [Polyangium spumosum]|uniref:Serine hydrolase n=1 Tax=Polyangium spumosum TaxID=889282 RepID=A0A6N7Q8H4_9BACT|nr:serine hydrolase [Polyangium spumosum]MRG97171.1 serine hydrolase [Polyangium spumosum]
MRTSPLLAVALLTLSACGSPSAGDSTPVVLAGPPPFPVESRAEWPTQAWPTADPASVGIDPAALKKLDDYLFTRHGDDVDRKGQRTNAFVLVKDGKLVFERYARGTTAETSLLTWSVSKSFVNTLIGIAVGEGRFRVDEPAGKYYTALGPDKQNVRITDLLRMSSGIDWNETYEASPVFSSVMAMLYTRGQDDMPRFVAGHGLAHAPGTRWSYSSGDTNVLLAALRATMSDAEYASYPWKALFLPLGMKSARFERDGAGNFVGSSYLYASARDLAKWGLLYLTDGVWEGKRLLPEGWVAYTLTMAPAYHTTDVPPPLWEDNPGAQVYLNVGDPARNIPRPWPAAPPDTFAALGHWGKSIFVIPSLDLVAVRLGDDREYGCSVHHASKGCVPDREKAFTKGYYLELLSGLVKR